jgi:hypothetical protein
MNIRCSNASHLMPLPWILLVLGIACDSYTSRTGPDFPCYVITPLYDTEQGVVDTTAARTAFEAYVQHLDDSNGYPVLDWEALEYVRSAGAVEYHDWQYWRIVACGTTQGGEPEETAMFCVRQDGRVVIMLGCI